MVSPSTSQQPGFMGTPGAGVTGKNASLACLAFLSAPSLMESVGDLDSNPDATTFWQGDLGQRLHFSKPLFSFLLNGERGLKTSFVVVPGHNIGKWSSTVLGTELVRGQIVFVNIKQSISILVLPATGKKGFQEEEIKPVEIQHRF